MELAYRLAVSEQPMIRDIRKNVVVLINPVSEPDGRDKVVDWFYRYLKGKTDYENLPRQSPPVLGPLRLPRQQPGHAPEGARADAAPSTGCSTTTTRRSFTISTSRSRCCTPGTAPGPTTPTSTRSSSASGSRCPSTRSAD